MAQNNAINNRSSTLTVDNAFTVTTGTVSINSGTSTLGISTDASATTVSLATGAAVKGVTLGSTNSTSATTVQSGSGALNITATNGALTINSGTGTLAIANDATAQTVNIATGAGAKVVTLGTTNGASSLALQTGTADFSLASATGTIISALDTGETTLPLQPAFLGFLASTVNNVTGNNALFTLGTTTALTEVFDQNSDFNTNGTFTAPVTGKYFLQGGGQLSGCTAATNFWIYISTSNRDFYLQRSRAASALVFGAQISALADMDSGDTAVIKLQAFGEAADTDDATGDATRPFNYFSGCLEV